MQHTAYLGLGANLGRREATIRRAIRLLEEQAGPVEAQSALFRSAPWGFESENAFVNAVVRIATTLSPIQLLDVTQAIERRLGKSALHATQRPSDHADASSTRSTADDGNGTQGTVYHDRPIDIDILLYDDIAMDTPRLTIPHPLMHERPFVMEPLRQVLERKNSNLSNGEIDKRA